MFKPLHTALKMPQGSPTILTTLLVPSVLLIGLTHATPADAQERQGCFMIDNTGQFFDLSSICPSGTQALGTGDIQATLRWATPDDLDMSISDPAGDTVDYSNTEIVSGGQLDVDANASCSEVSPSPVENIFWPRSQAPQGQYTIQVNLYSRCGSSSGPIPFSLTLLVQGTTQTLNGVLDDQTSTVTFPFTVPLQQQQAQQL